MAKKVYSKGAPVIIGQDRWGYREVAAHLGVSRRTLVRYITSGAIPQPMILNNRGVWHGESLVAVRGGIQIPGTFDYRPNARELKRVGTIQEKARALAKAKRSRAARAGHAKRAKGVPS